MKSKFVIESGGKINGEIPIPGDKSISHRAVILASIAEGNSHITGLLRGEDVLYTIGAMRALGVTIEENTNGDILIHGTSKFRTPKEPIYLGNSGTSMRLLCGLLCGLNISTDLHGDSSLSSRPMKRIADPLCSMGFRVTTTDQGTAPLSIQAIDDIKNLENFDYSLPIASAQIKSCLLLANLFSHSRITIKESLKSRNHTELMLKDFGADIRFRGNETTLCGEKTLVSHDVQIPTDISSAAFAIVAASIMPGSNLTLRNVGMNPTRDGMIHLLRKMGANIALSNKQQCGSEPTCDITVKYASLRGIDIEPQYVPLTIDEFPALFIAAACAKGKTRLRQAEDLRNKESDRIAVMANALTQMNIKVTSYDDGITILGGKLQAPPQPIDAQDDHRIAMALSVAGMALTTGKLVIDGTQIVDTSFPNFHSIMADSGMKISLK